MSTCIAIASGTGISPRITESVQAAVGAGARAPGPAARGGRAAAACTAANNQTGWLSGATCTTSTNYTCSYDSTMYCIQVTLTYPYAANPLVPAVALFDAVLPTTLTSRATVQINPTNII